ncbi:hypothetical protein ACNHUS_32175 [Actinomycetes bacterium M1A6_2h]
MSVSRVLITGSTDGTGRAAEPHPAVHDEQFRSELLAALAQHTGTALPQT